MGILVLLTYIALRSYALDVSRITKFLPRRPSAKSIKQNLDHEPDVMAIDDEAADEIFSTLSSATARSILTALYDQPRTASELADEGETSLQNVQYHLNNLSDSGLIEVVETWESDQRREMKVYAPPIRRSCCSLATTFTGRRSWIPSNSSLDSLESSRSLASSSIALYVTGCHVPPSMWAPRRPLASPRCSYSPPGCSFFSAVSLHSSPSVHGGTTAPCEMFQGLRSGLDPYPRGKITVIVHSRPLSRALQSRYGYEPPHLPCLADRLHHREWLSQ